MHRHWTPVARSSRAASSFAHPGQGGQRGRRPRLAPRAGYTATSMVGILGGERSVRNSIRGVEFARNQNAAGRAIRAACLASGAIRAPHPPHRRGHHHGGIPLLYAPIFHGLATSPAGGIARSSLLSTARARSTSTTPSVTGHGATRGAPWPKPATRRGGRANRRPPPARLPA